MCGSPIYVGTRQLHECVPFVENYHLPLLYVTPPDFVTAKC
jgi:hypothetical protein